MGTGQIAVGFALLAALFERLLESRDGELVITREKVLEAALEKRIGPHFHQFLALCTGRQHRCGGSEQKAGYEQADKRNSHRSVVRARLNIFLHSVYILSTTSPFCSWCIRAKFSSKMATGYFCRRPRT